MDKLKQNQQPKIVVTRLTIDLL